MVRKAESEQNLFHRLYLIGTFVYSIYAVTKDVNWFDLAIRSQVHISNLYLKCSIGYLTMALCLKNVKFLENDNEICSKDLPKISLELFGKSESIPFDSMEQLKKFLKTPNLKSGIKRGRANGKLLKRFGIKFW